MLVLSGTLISNHIRAYVALCEKHVIGKHTTSISLFIILQDDRPCCSEQTRFGGFLDSWSRLKCYMIHHDSPFKLWDQLIAWQWCLGKHESMFSFILINLGNWDWIKKLYYSVAFDCTCLHIKMQHIFNPDIHIANIKPTLVVKLHVDNVMHVRAKLTDPLDVAEDRVPWTSYRIPKITDCACARNAGNVSPATVG